MSKKNIVTKDAKHGHRLMICDDEKVEFLVSEDTDGWEEIVENAIADGYSLMLHKKTAMPNYYIKTKDKSTDIRDLARYLETNDWSHKLDLDNSVDHPTWCRNIDLFFERLMNDDVFIEKANSLREDTVDVEPKNGNDEFSLVEVLVGAPRMGERFVKRNGKWVSEECVIHSAKSWLKDQDPPKGKTGKRPSRIYTWLTNTRRPPGRKEGAPMGFLTRKIYDYLKKNRGWA